jgi:hypothetical protein
MTTVAHSANEQLRELCTAEFAARPKRQRVSDDDKVEALKHRLRGEARSVAMADIEDARQYLASASKVTRDLASGELTMQQIIAQHNRDVLDEITKGLSTSTGGSGMHRRMQLQDICRALVPDLVHLEEVIGTCKALYAELMGECQQAVGAEFNVLKADAADLSLVNLRKAVEGAADLKKELEMREAVNKQLQEQMRAMQQRFEEQVQLQATAIARQMVSRSASEASDVNMS